MGRSSSTGFMASVGWKLRRVACRSMIRRIYEVDPLVCEYGAEMKVIAFNIEHAVIRRILGHVRGQEEGRGRGPPGFAA